jgi:AAA domain
LGFVAVTVASGNWSEEALRALTCYERFILEDNDEPGRKRAQNAAAALYGIAACVRIVSLPGLPEKGDVSDWLDGGNDHNQLLDIARAAQPWTPDEADVGGEPLPFVSFENLQVIVKKSWLLKNVVALGETSSWIALPGKGKSALLTDIAIHVASGRDWRGYRAKGRFAVVYVAFERGDLLKRRLEAYKRKHGFQDLPIVVVTAAVDITEPGCIPILVATIKAVGDHYGMSVGLLVLDTFAKAIALGGRDEDKAKDQNRVLGHMRLVQQETGVHVAYVGHTGKDESRGARGSNSHLGDVDVIVQLSGDLVKSAIVTKANDQPEGPLTTFALEPFEFGHDEDGDPITTAIVSDVVPDKEARASRKRPLTDRQKVALDALTEALITFGTEAPGSFEMARDVRVVDADKWRDELFRRGVLDRAAANPRKEFFRLREALAARCLIGLRDELVWKVSP